MPQNIEQLQDLANPERTVPGVSTPEVKVGDSSIVEKAIERIGGVQAEVAKALGLGEGSERAVAETDSFLVDAAEKPFDESETGNDDALETALIAGALEEQGLRISDGENPIGELEEDGLGDQINAVVKELHENSTELPDHTSAAEAVARAIDDLSKHPVMDEGGVEQSQDSFMGVGVNPNTGNFDAALMPDSEDEALNKIHDKSRRGEPMTLGEGLRNGRDTIQTSLGGIELRSDAVYRGTNMKELLSHMQTGRVEGTGPGDEYTESDDGEHNNNGGVDWYLGGAATRYGDVILEAPARPDYFQPGVDNGTRMVRGAEARHMKSSGNEKPLPLDLVHVITKNPVTGEYVRRTAQDVIADYKN